MVYGEEKKNQETEDKIVLSIEYIVYREENKSQKQEDSMYYITFLLVVY